MGVLLAPFVGMLDLKQSPPSDALEKTELSKTKYRKYTQLVTNYFDFADDISESSEFLPRCLTLLIYPANTVNSLGEIINSKY